MPSDFLHSNCIEDPRFTFSVKPTQVVTLLSHRRKATKTQFLAQWSKINGEKQNSSEAVYSWHAVDELRSCLHLVQQYVDETAHLIYNSTHQASDVSKDASLVSRKRKAPGAEPEVLENASGLLTPLHSQASRSSSRASNEANDVTETQRSEESQHEVYNGVILKKEGWLIAKQLSRDSQSWKHIEQTQGMSHARIDTLPTAYMVAESRKTTFSEEVALAIREAFLTKMTAVPQLYLENNVDSSTPSLNFTFITEFVLRDGVEREDPETNEGCKWPCRPNMGKNIGCESSRKCSCLDEAAVDEPALERQDPEQHRLYMSLKERGEIENTIGLPKRFPYTISTGDTPARLQSFHQDLRHPIYECNSKCCCGSSCKNRLVQKGRMVPLVIFKTTDRGWGVYCNEDLLRGEFVDTYLGEVITNDEADRREERASVDKHSYLYTLDKFVGDRDDLTEDTCYVVDGQYMGGPMRFVNHSCEPNLWQYTISYNKRDKRVYDLAFFANKDIPSGTELTFDYLDQDEVDHDTAVRKREEASRDPLNANKTRCNCGAGKCRGFLWVK